MPRAPRKGDASTNARKRYYRASERYLKKAEQSSGATAKKYRQLARQNFDDALATYDPSNTQRYSKSIQKLAGVFGVDIERRRELPRDESAREREVGIRAKRQRRVIAESGSVRESDMQDEDARREQEAQTLFRSSEIGRRIIGGYVDVWRDYATVTDPETGERRIDTKRIFKALFAYFNVDNLPDLIEAVEDDVGETLYEMGNDDEIYEVVKLTIQNKVLSVVA